MMVPQHCRSTDACNTTTTDGAVLTTARQDCWLPLACGNNVSDGGADDTTSVLLLVPCLRDDDDSPRHPWSSLSLPWRTMAPWHCCLHHDLATTETVIAHECVATMAP